MRYETYRTAPTWQKPLRRERSDRMLAGVCGGLAAWLGIDSTVVRVSFALAGLLTGLWPLALLYGLLWIILPEPRSRSLFSFDDDLEY